MEIGNKMLKLNWKFRIVSAILTGLLFIGIMCLMDYLLDGEFQSLNSYLFQGIFFGVFMGIGFPYVTQKFGTKFTTRIGKNIKPELTENENIEAEGPANLFRGIATSIFFKLCTLAPFIIMCDLASIDDLVTFGIEFVKC